MEKKSGRGGFRPGAGRKKKQLPAAAFEVRPPDPDAISDAEIRAEARRHARLAIAVLAGIASCGVTEAARVSAARALLDRATGSAASSVGKKEIAAARAEAAAADDGSDWGDDLAVPLRPN